MATLLEISNQALLRVGDKVVTAITDNNARADAVEHSWQFVRREVLRSHPWNIAVTRAQLTAHVTAPTWGFATAYDLPAACLNLLEVDTTADWRVEGAQIVTDATGTLDIRYVTDETDTELYDGLLTEVMVVRLAAEIVERVTSSKTKKEMLLIEYENLLAEARAQDGHESSPAEFEEDSWVTARL